MKLGFHTTTRTALGAFTVWLALSAALPTARAQQPGQGGRGAGRGGFGGRPPGMRYSARA
jgi:hypothetical protein